MIVPGSANSLLLAQGAATGYNLTNSLRFRSSATAYLSRTPSSAGNLKTWTWSGWVKRGSFANNVQPLFDSGQWTGGQPLTIFAFIGDKLNTQSGVYGVSTAYSLNTAAVFRDPSAWYHFVIAYDTTQATDTNRVKIYVNGVLQTLTGTYPSQNYNTCINDTIIHRMGYDNQSNEQFDGYMAEINAIDGQALTPSSFGENNSTTGVWQPKKYTGTYGTNGFYLPFTDIATTSGSNAGLGKDFSGNGNYWNTNNISVTSGATYDSMTDVPTLTSATTANYAVMNPLNTYNTIGTYSDGNLNYSYPSSGGSGTSYGPALSTIAVPSGVKAYFEFTSTTATYPLAVGITQTGTQHASNQYAGYNSTEYYYNPTNGNKLNNNTSTAYGASFTSNDVIGVALDLVNGQVTFYKNGASQGVAFTGLSGSYNFGVGTVAGGNTCTGYANFGQQPFAYTPPTGYVALNTYNLPTSTIVAGNKVMDATTYTGNGSTQNITNAGGFKPDFVWAKARSAAYDHSLVDSVRGVSRALFSDLTNAEDYSAGNYINAFNSNGFGVGGAGTNGNGVTFVGWQWQAGQGTTSSNTNGSITSTVSVNPTAGFSVVTFTSASSGNFTVGHGLGVKPAFFIVKTRDTAGWNWGTWHQSLSSNTNSVLNLNTTAAESISFNMWGASGANSTTIGITAGNPVPASSACVAYCWAEVAGFSKFGSYTGNGSTDGSFVYTGFRPKFVMIKASSSVSFGNWVIKDTTRNPSNIADADLYANLNYAEDTVSSVYIDILSNGFKLRGTYDGINGNGSSYIYMAFAENPQRYALAR